MKTFLVLVCLLGVCRAGRRFSEEAQDDVVDMFRRFNNRLRWSDNHHLAALSARYCTCESVGRQGYFRVDRTMPDDTAITGLADYVRSDVTDVDSVTSLIRTTLNRWTSDPRFSDTIRDASEFGCSSQPGCDGQVEIVCLFAGSSRFSGWP